MSTHGRCRPQPPAPGDDLAEATDALTEADIPPDPEDYARAEALDGPPPEIAALGDAALAALLDATPPGPAVTPEWPLSYPTTDRPWPAGVLPRDGTGGGAGFADGGALDLLDAGAVLAGHADDAHARLDSLPDDDLVGVLRAWRRLTSWAQAGELGAIAALARRRPADGTPPAAAPGQFPAVLSEFTGAEVAAALTLTGMAAEKQVTLACQFAARPSTLAALAAGRIDLPRARLLVTTLTPLATAHAATVEALLLPQAPEMTTGQLRAALDRAILALDPEAMRRRREDAEREARVEHYPAPDGTATLAGRNLPPAQALAADKRLTALATAWKKLGAQGGMDLLRAYAYLALLNGLSTDLPPASLLPSAPGDGEPLPGDNVPAGLCRPPDAGELPPLTGRVRLTIPLTTLMHLGQRPPATPPGTARYTPTPPACWPAPWPGTAPPAGRSSSPPPTAPPWPLAATADQPATAPRPARPAASPGGSGWTVKVTAEPIATSHCDHRNAEPGYRPSPHLQRLIRARSTTCTGPGCRRPARPQRPGPHPRLRRRRDHLRVPGRTALPLLPSAQTIRGLETPAAQPRRDDLAHPRRPQTHHPPHQPPHLTGTPI